MYDLGHGLNVSKLSRKIGVILGMNTKDLALLYASGLYHDIGKVFLPKEVLEKPAALSQDEYGFVKLHVTIGQKTLSQINDELHNTAANVALYHHERINGSGYLGLKGEQIPLFARIVMVADVYDALTSDRPYRKRLDNINAIGYLKMNSGILFDNEVVDALIESVIIYPCH